MAKARTRAFRETRAHAVSPGLRSHQGAVPAGRRVRGKLPQPPASVRRVGGYRAVLSPLLAEIIGACRPWTVSMISALSIPWR